jgi:MFS family permease
VHFLCTNFAFNFLTIMTDSSAKTAETEKAVGPESELSDDVPAVPTQHDQQFKTVKYGPIREILIIAVLCSTQLFVQGCYGYILIPLRHVGKTFGQDSASDLPNLAWHVSAYSLTVGTFILPAGRLGDIYGYKKILVAGWIWFAFWGLVGGCAAFTASSIFFDTVRALQGIGPAVLLPNALAIAGRNYPPGMKKNIIFSVFALTAPIGTCTAGLVGSALAQYVWWPWVMWIYSIGCATLAVGGWLLLPPDEFDKSRGLQTFDTFGAVLGVAGLLLLNFRSALKPYNIGRQRH